MDITKTGGTSGLPKLNIGGPSSGGPSSGGQGSANRIQHGADTSPQARNIASMQELMFRIGQYIFEKYTYQSTQKPNDNELKERAKAGQAMKNTQNRAFIQDHDDGVWRTHTSTALKAIQSYISRYFSNEITGTLKTDSPPATMPDMLEEAVRNNIRILSDLAALEGSTSASNLTSRIGNRALDVITNNYNENIKNPSQHAMAGIQIKSSMLASLFELVNAVKQIGLQLPTTTAALAGNQQVLSRTQQQTGEVDLNNLTPDVLSAWYESKGIFTNQSTFVNAVKQWLSGKYMDRITKEYPAIAAVVKAYPIAMGENFNEALLADLSKVNSPKSPITNETAKLASDAFAPIMDLKKYINRVYSGLGGGDRVPFGIGQTNKSSQIEQILESVGNGDARAVLEEATRLAGVMSTQLFDRLTDLQNKRAKTAEQLAAEVKSIKSNANPPQELLDFMATSAGGSNIDVGTWTYEQIELTVIMFYTRAKAQVALLQGQKTAQSQSNVLEKIAQTTSWMAIENNPMNEAIKNAYLHMTEKLMSQLNQLKIFIIRSFGGNRISKQQLNGTLVPSSILQQFSSGGGAGDTSGGRGDRSRNRGYGQGGQGGFGNEGGSGGAGGYGGSSGNYGESGDVNGPPDVNIPPIDYMLDMNTIQRWSTSIGGPQFPQGVPVSLNMSDFNSGDSMRSKLLTYFGSGHAAAQYLYNVVGVMKKAMEAWVGKVQEQIQHGVKSNQQASKVVGQTQQKMLQWIDILVNTAAQLRTVR